MRRLRLLLPLPDGWFGTGMGTEGIIRGEGFTAVAGGALSITGKRSGIFNVTGGCFATGLWSRSFLASVMVTDIRFSRGRS